jgi:hypothetical protein
MHIYSWLSGLLLFCICSALAAAPVSSDRDCPYEPLPTSLDTLSGLGFNGELHVHNEYYAQYTRGQNHAITFTLTQESAFRIYIEPHTVDIDIWLYKDTTAIAHTSDYSLADEVVHKTLDPGNYRIRIYFFGTLTGSCPTVNMEISIIPTADLTQRISSYTCPPTQAFPNIIDGATVDVAGYSYDSTSTPSVVYNAQYTPNGAFAFLKNYTFTLPRVNQMGDTWEIEAILGIHFPTSALGLLMTDTFNPPKDLSCFDAGNCSIASHNVQGQSTLKALVLPGTYVLWIYDVPRDRNVSLVSCQPFTMSMKISHVQQIEDYLNCEGEPFPYTVNEAGIMDDHGYMYYREDILIDLATPNNDFRFTVKEDSYFRAYTATHRIDIDLKLKNATNNATLAYGYAYGSAEEAIQKFIPAGDYIFEMILFGKYAEVFCETALLEIAVSPKSLYNGYDVCTGQPTSAPDLTGLAALSTGAATQYVMTYKEYRYNYTNVNTQNAVITSQAFNLTTESYLKAELGSNFLLGDIRFLLTSKTVGNATTTQTELGYHRRNMHFVDIKLPRSQMSMSYTEYTLTILTADTQGTGAFAGFPPCATYSLTLSVIPSNITGPQLCLRNRPFPSNLNTPQNLKTAPKIHLQEEFLVPKIDSLYAKETVVWENITTPSYFRFYVEPHHIDVDLKLEENGTTVAQGISFNLEEVIAWVLKPNTKYQLTLTYYKWYFVDHGNDPCYTYSAELAITPVTEANSANCTGISLPSDLPPVVANSPVFIEQDYFFTQEANPRDILIHFQVTAPSLFRAAVTYDFVWNDLALKLDLPGSSDPVQGDLDYNRNEITLIQLSKGNHTLHIYEPFNTTSSKTFNLRNCVQFHMTLGIEVIIEDEVDPLLLSCEDQYFPPSWNTPALLSNLSGNIVDFNRDVLADISDRTDSFSFTLDTQSVFRLYIPVDPLLDVDVTLYKGSSSIASQVSYGKEESIMISLAPATYTAKFTYYGLQQTSILPPASACAAFRISVAIYPLAALQAESNLTNTCTTSLESSTLNIAPATNPVSVYYQRSLETQINFYAFTLFTVRTTSLFTVRFEQNDVTAGIAMLLQAKNVSKTYNPLYFQDRIYLNEYLLAGTYNLSFHDPLGKNPLPLKCAPYTLTYTLVAADVPAGTCDADTLPSDLNTTSGGSTNFGGPQAADGSIHFYGNNFAMPKGVKNRDNYILISAPKKSYMRIFLAVETGNTITANLFQNPNMTSSAPIASTVARGGIDRSNVWILQAQADYYVLDLHFTTVSSAADCSIFSFELVLEPEATVLSNLACPSPLPAEINQLPPETITVYQGQDYNISSDYLVTSQKYSLNSRNGSYIYTMTITVQGNFSLSAIVAYDFLVNEFALVLQDSKGSNLTTGIHQEAPANDADNNFMNYLQWRLAPDTYRLRIVDIGAKTYNLTTFCHYFTFALTISSVTPGGNPRIIQIYPTSGNDLNPIAALSLQITFSEPAGISIPVGSSLTTHLAESKIAYLKGAGVNGINVTAVEAYWDASNTVLHLRFLPQGGFGDGQSYQLVLDYTRFYTRRNNSEAFAAGQMANSHTYNMHRCSGCSGHGVCVTTPTGGWTCACIANWTGNNCDRCATGFHPAGVQCLPNTFCSNTTCNGHGTCSDANGFPTCVCRNGYAGETCATCAPGFVLDGTNCTSNTTDEDEDEACTAPLLPTDLSTPAYLGYTGHVHLQGWYYINQDARQHETKFSISQRSLMRIYTEPYEIDIDLWLYKVGADGSLSVVAFRIQFGLEETLFVKLDPGNYMVRFRYFMWVTPSTTCATFNLEWAIAPIDSVIAETSNSKAFCGGLPNIPPLNVTQPYKFSQTSFGVSAPTQNGTQANYFYKLNITIAPPPNQVANLRASVGYRFLPGDLSILLEAGTKGTHCGNTGTSFSLSLPQGCTYGDNLENMNVLHTFLEPGDYILWIYEPIVQFPDVSTCSPFDFSLDIEFVDDEADIFSCNLPMIPVSLDSSQYQERPGYIHFRDTFVLSVDRAMSFTVSQPSLFRAVVIGRDTSVVLYNSKTGSGVPTMGDTQSISAALDVGTYYLKFSADMVWFCPRLEIEFALAPTTRTPAIDTTCPPGSGNPPPLTISAIPFEFGPTRARPTVTDYYTMNTPNTPVVARYPFTLTSKGFIDSQVDSDFLLGNLHLELWRGSNLVKVGDYNNNQNLMQLVIEPANYELRIVLPTGQRAAGMPSCIRYNFELRLSYTSANSPGCNTNNLPYSFNTMHFLGYDGTMHFQADNWRVPSLSFATFHNINFSVPQASLVRIYTEPHTIDIDIKILSAAGAVLASGSNAIGTEESLTYMLNASTTYIFQLQFYNFFGSGFSIPPCESFNMEVEIGPIPTRPAICPNQGSNWPQIPTSIPLPYSYNSIDNGFNLYFQQVSRQPQAKNFSVTFASAANVHIEVGYDYLVGDLVVKLYSITTKDTYYGSNKQDRNILNLINLPKGQYVLTIYEAAANLDIVLACSDFTFAFYAEEYSALISEDRYLIEYYFPSSMDTISYLLASPKAHLAANFYMFDGTSAHESTSFTVKQTSILRVGALMFESEVASTHHNSPGVALYDNAGKSVASNPGALLLTLQPGKYTLKFTPPVGFTEQDDLGVPVAIQFAIDTTSNLQQELTLSPAKQDCSPTVFDPILVSPNGEYQDGENAAYASFSQLSVGTEIVNRAFTLDRFSVVYLQVGSQFLLSDLEARVISSNNNSLVWRGRMRKNTNVVHQALPAGNYIATIRQPVAQSTTNSLAHCAIYSYSLIIKDANDPSAVVDCTSLQAVPWQLDTAAGGSTPFGGPISSDGYLHFYGENMHVPMQYVSYMNFTVTKPSLVSILVVNYPTAFAGVDYIMQNSVGADQSPSQALTSSTDRSRINLYSLQASPYKLGISYRRGSSVAGICYSYTLQVDIAPADTIQKQVTCPSGITGAPLPDALLVDSTTNFVAGSIDSFFQGWASVKGLQKSITFSTKGTSTPVVLSLSYNSMVTAFTMKMYNAKNSLVATAQVRGQQIKSGKTNVYLYLGASVPAGNYTVNITHPSNASPFMPALQVCAPFFFSYTVGTATRARVEITDVAPPSVNGLSSGENLVLTITFSNNVYATGKIPVLSVNSSLVINSFYLAGSDLSNKEPSKAEAVDQKALKWRLTFPMLTTSAVTYNLAIKPNTLFDQVGYPITLPNPSPYQYTTIDCGPFGQLKGGKCVCNPGYAGANCDTCDSSLGYVHPAGSQLCVLDQCQPNSCGCIDASCNAKIGICSTNATGMAHCACPAAYQGERCEACRDGYAGYPNCVPSCTPACVHGTCTGANKCQCVGNWDGKACEVCPSNFKGANCDQCADGFTGEKCDQQKSRGSDWGATKTFLEVTGVLVIVALAAAGAFWYWRYRRAGTRYQLVSRFNMDDDDEDTHHFPHADNRLVDDDDVPPMDNERDEEEEEEEPRVELPRGGGNINSAPEEPPVSGSSNPPKLLDM